MLIFHRFKKIKFLFLIWSQARFSWFISYSFASLQFQFSLWKSLLANIYNLERWKYGICVRYLKVRIDFFINHIQIPTMDEPIFNSAWRCSFDSSHPFHNFIYYCGSSCNELVISHFISWWKHRKFQLWVYRSSRCWTWQYSNIIYVHIVLLCHIQLVHFLYDQLV